MAAISPTTGTNLLSKPTPSLQLKINRAIFGIGPSSDNLHFFQSYFDYYVEELELLQFGASVSARLASELAVKTHEDVLYLVSTLAKVQNPTRRQVRAQIRKDFPSASDAGLNRSIDLALRLCLMLNINELQYRSLRHPTPCLGWGEEEPLQQRVEHWFPCSRWDMNPKESRLDPYFTAANMATVCGLKVQWTTSLQDHLRLDRRQKMLRIFPYRNFLQALLTRNSKTSEDA